LIDEYNGLARYVETLNILGDESRLRLCALIHERELTVTDLVLVTGIAQSRVSTHLARLRDGGFVRDRRDGTRSFWVLAKDFPETAKTLLGEAFSFVGRDTGARSAAALVARRAA